MVTTSARSAIPAAPRRAVTALEQPVGLGLLGVGPLGHRDEVDLAPVEPLGHDPCLEATVGQTGHGDGRRAVEGQVLGVGGVPTVEEDRALGRHLEDLRAPIAAEVQAAGSTGTGRQLTVDVLEVGAGDDDDVRARGTEGLDDGPGPPGVGVVGRAPRCRPSRPRAPRTSRPRPPRRRRRGRRWAEGSRWSWRPSGAQVRAGSPSGRPRVRSRGGAAGRGVTAPEVSGRPGGRAPCPCRVRHAPT